MKTYQRVLTSSILLIFIMSILVGCASNSSSSSISKQQTEITNNSINSKATFGQDTIPASDNKIDYKSLLPSNYDWNILKTVPVDSSTGLTIVCAYCERPEESMLGQFFVFAKDNTLLWKSPEFEDVSILDENIYTLKTGDMTLVYGEHIWGGARGMMYSGIVFIIDKNNNFKVVNKNIDLWLNGSVTVTNNAIILEGDAIDNQFELSIVNGIYRERLIPDSNSKKTDIYTITDIENWNHPVKTLLDNYSITLKKAELLKNKTYPIFYLGNDGGLLDECFYSDLWNIAKVNGFWSYKLVDEEDKMSVEVVCDRNKKRLLKAIKYSQETNGDKTNTEKVTDEYHVNINNHNKLNDNDFKVTINGLQITKDMYIGDITEKIGTGTATENNNYGYIGRSADGYNRTRFGYTENNVTYDLIILDESNLERIDVDFTAKGLHTGDSLSKLIDLYGKPDFEILKDKDRYSEYVYSYKGKQFVAGLSKDKIEYISLQFMNLYEY